MNALSFLNHEKQVAEIIAAGAVFECQVCNGSIKPIRSSKDLSDFSYLVADQKGFGIALWYLDAPDHHACMIEAKRRAEQKAQKEIEDKKQKELDQKVKELASKIPHESAHEASFENFIVTDENKEAMEMIKAWRPDDEFGLLLSGPSGTGKSHAMIATAKALASFGASVEFIQASSFFDQCAKNEFKIPNELLRAQFLFLDDLGAENISDIRREWLFTLLEARKNNRRTTFISTNLNVKDLREKFFERIASRIFELTIPVVFGGKDMRLEKLKMRLADFKQRLKK